MPSIVTGNEYLIYWFVLAGFIAFVGIGTIVMLFKK